jgi:sialidase-1
LSAPLHSEGHEGPFWNCPRLSLLSDGRLAAVVDRVVRRQAGGIGGEQENVLWLSEDKGSTWQGPYPTPVYGIVPDRLVVLQHGSHAGRWVLSAHTVLGTPEEPTWAERCWLSDDEGATWQGPQTIAAAPGLQLCEGSVAELPAGELVCVMRENSGRGLDAFKAISEDGGVSWQGPIELPIPACHRPVAGMLRSGRVLITHRFMQGGKGWVGWWTQNTFAALTDVESCLARSRKDAHARIMPLDYDRSPESDTGYTGWVQFPDGEIYVANYVLDDAPKAQIRGYAFSEDDFYA